LDTLAGHGEWVQALGYSPDGSLLISSGRTGPTPKIKFWDVATGEMIQYYDESALELDVSPDGQYFAYGRAGGGVVLARTGQSTGIEEPVGAATPVALAAPSPNPFRGETTLRFAIPSAGDVQLSVYDVAGRLVATLLSEPRSTGEHAVRWDGRDDAGRDVPSGTYFARVEAGGSLGVGKVVVIR
jgi:WD40 repeat protein